MNREVAILREAVVKVTQLLTSSGLTVTQRGTTAYVKSNAKTHKPELVNIPFLPDNASDELIFAVQGFIDHEVGHILETDFSVTHEAAIKGREVHGFWNILEDTFIERKMGERFPGTPHNLDRMYDFFIRELTQPIVDKALAANDSKMLFRALIVPIMRAWAGQRRFKNYLDEKGFWTHPDLKPYLDRIEQFKDLVPKLRSSQDCLTLAEELNAVLNPAPPPTPPMPAPPPPSSAPSTSSESDEKSDDDDGEGSNTEKPEDEDDKGSGGDPGESDEDDTDAGDEGGEADDGEGAEKEESKSDDDAGDDDGAEAGEDDSSDEVGEGSDDDSRSDDLEAGDDPDADEEDEENLGDEGDGASDDEGGDGDDRPEGESDREQDDEDDSGSAEEDGGDAEDDRASGDDPGDNDGDQDDTDAAGDPEAEESGDDHSAGSADHDNSDDEGEAGSASSDTDEEDDTPFKQSESLTPSEKADEDGEGANPTTNAPMPETVGAPETFEDQLSERISKEAMTAAVAADYHIYTRDFDKIEPFEVDPESYKDQWLVDLDDKTQKMVGTMQKEIERMMAARSQCVRVPGYRSGRLHSAGLHRLMAGDDRVFRRKFENKSKDVAVGLLIDNSGSMSSVGKIHVAMSAGYALSSTLEKVGIKHEVIGFTTFWKDMYNNKAMINEIQEEMRRIGRDFSRIEPIYMPIFKSFDERLTPAIKKRFAAAPFGGHLGANADGESVEIAALRLLQRTEQRKVLIVLSDGQPTCSGDHAQQVRKLHDVVAANEKAGIETIGIGILDYSVKHYYPKSMVLNDLNALPGIVMGELKRILTA